MVSLKKGGSISLSKEASSLGIKLSKVNIGLGWDIAKRGSSFDLDAWAFVEGSDGTTKNKNIVYFGNSLDTSREIRHCGDNLTGEGDGDDEVIQINLDCLPDTYEKIYVGVTIYRGLSKKQSFKDIDNTFIRAYDVATNTEIFKYSDGFKGEAGDFVSLLFGIFYRDSNRNWCFKALGVGNKNTTIASMPNAFLAFGINLDTNNQTNLNGGQRKMAVSLSKGGKVSLAKVAADSGISGGLTKVVVGLGWSINRYDGGAQFDLDAAAFMCGENGKVRSDADFIFYNQKVGPGVEHTGDNRTGEGDGDDEQIKIDLTAIPADVNEVSFTVTIDQADVRNQNFGMVEDSYVRVMDESTGTELIRYDLGEDFSVETAIVIAKLYRHNGEWKFNAVGSGFSGGLAALCNNFGVDVG